MVVVVGSGGSGTGSGGGSVSAWIRARVWARVCKWFRTRELGHGLGLGH